VTKIVNGALGRDYRRCGSAGVSQGHRDGGTLPASREMALPGVLGAVLERTTVFRLWDWLASVDRTLPAIWTVRPQVRTAFWGRARFESVREGVLSAHPLKCPRGTPKVRVREIL